MNRKRRREIICITTYLVLGFFLVILPAENFVRGLEAFAASILTSSILVFLLHLGSRRVSPYLTNERFWEAYREYRRAFAVAMVLQVAGVILGAFLLNYGTGISYLLGSAAFWMVASGIFFARRFPKLVERIALAAAPAAIFVACWYVTSGHK